jgi:hypothetical protein
MFRTFFPSIIRSSRLYTQNRVYVIQVIFLLVSGHKIFHLVPASKQSTNLYDIYKMLCLQSRTPDDGRKDRPKHVEWYSINSKIVHLVRFTTEIANSMFPSVPISYIKIYDQYHLPKDQYHLPKWSVPFTKMISTIYQNDQYHLPNWSVPFTKMISTIYQNDQYHLPKWSVPFTKI